MSRDDDRDVLEPLVVAPAVLRNWPAFGGEVVDQLDFFASPRRSRGDLGAQAEHAEQVLVSLARDLGLGDHLERQHAGIEGERPVQVADRDRDRIDPLDRGAARGSRPPAHASASNRRSSTKTRIGVTPPLQMVAEAETPGVDRQRRVDPARARQTLPSPT